MMKEFERLLDTADDIGEVVEAHLNGNGNIWIKIVDSKGQEFTLTLARDNWNDGF